MKRICCSLSDGATRYIGIYYCDDCNVTVEVQLRAHPDVPYDLYKEDKNVG